MLCRVELGPKAGDIRLVACGPEWIEEVKALTGTRRLRAVEPTLRGYIALRLQSVGMLRPIVSATEDERQALHRTMEALAAIPWDPGTRVEFQNALREGWEREVTGHRAEFLRRAVNRCLLGPVRPALEGSATVSGPQGTREAALAGN